MNGFIQSRDALPALQVYRDEQLIGNFIRLNAELDDDYDGAELYKFLKRSENSKFRPFGCESNLGMTFRWNWRMR